MNPGISLVATLTFVKNTFRNARGTLGSLLLFLLVGGCTATDSAPTVNSPSTDSKPITAPAIRNDQPIGSVHKEIQGAEIHDLAGRTTNAMFNLGVAPAIRWTNAIPAAPGNLHVVAN